jgi:hypothetical protein
MTAFIAPGAWRIECGAGAPRISALDAARVESRLMGQTFEHALRLTGLLHALCPHAHRVALSRAIEAATGHVASDTVEARRDHIVAIEAAAAAAFRFGATWPQAFGASIDPLLPLIRAHAQSAVAALEAGRCALEPLLALGTSLAEMLSPDSRMFDLLPNFSPLRACADKDDGQATLYDRIDAMIDDARRRASELLALDLSASKANRCRREIAAGRADTLRGALHVRVKVSEGTLSACEIDAPITRLMRADGALARALHGRTDLSLARLVVLAFDPCAGVHVVAAVKSEPAYA